jgi:hypothetical protein
LLERIMKIGQIGALGLERIGSLNGSAALRLSGNFKLALEVQVRTSSIPQEADSDMAPAA